MLFFPIHLIIYWLFSNEWMHFIKYKSLHIYDLFLLIIWQLTQDKLKIIQQSL